MANVTYVAFFSLGTRPAFIAWVSAKHIVYCAFVFLA